MVGMDLDSCVGVLVAVVLTAYLLYALVYPHRF
jgi:K+-transporting ATPase KdpF subunit